ncbi:UPF0061 protein [Neolecta irregularis DAH-3]|uniref:Selenoprotein O n=1 Tax=Neolecta irregularis (strain DAH-3) TaxID=1198029 RepID=A0A1U7LIC1_NEOID|nr:UPF0061 protein [Neolecta irregularis DAH-3]|eukprot:OLL22343.1 UPF0061 protein [Neolecta irregularis DAH-3]
MLPPDPLVPTPAAAKSAGDSLLRHARPVTNGAFTYISPVPSDNPKLLCTSPAAFLSLGLSISERETPRFRDLVSGNYFWEDCYPWSTCYGGWQFGSWAGQLGDGRAISLGEITNTGTNERFELQLKGAGKTPYSRFAGDGNAVLRSSIREFLVSEALHALNIPTTRALSLVKIDRYALRETVEQCAIVCRMAQSWLRIGHFDLPRLRGDRDLLRRIADYAIKDVFDGVDKLPEPFEAGGNRYERFYREVIQRSARTTSKWQAYGFINGVLNTDNISIFGLSLDFGPFAFMDTFDPDYTPNHDDHMLRYSYRNQPSVMWWNLNRFGIDICELFASENKVDDPEFISKGINDNDENTMNKKAERVIMAGITEFKKIFMEDYKELMRKRLGFVDSKDTDFDFTSETLNLMEVLKLDFHHFFRRLSSVPLFTYSSPLEFEEGAKIVLPARDSSNSKAIKKMSHFLQKYQERLRQEETTDDIERKKRMNEVNPKFVLRPWLVQEIVRRVEKDGEEGLLDRIMKMLLSPFDDHWGDEEEERFCGDVPQTEQQLQCSCSS